MPHPRTHQQAAGPGAVQQHHPMAVVVLGDRLQWVPQHRRDPRVRRQVRLLLVRDQLGLQDNPRRTPHRLDHILDGRDRPLRERHQPARAHPHPGLPRRGPLDRALEQTGAQVQPTVVLVQVAVAYVERRVAHQQPDELAVGDIDQALVHLRIAVTRLRVRQRPLLVETVEVGARDGERLTLVQIPPQPNVAVRQREQRLRLREQIQVQRRLAHRPRLDRVRPLHDHERSSSSARSPTTVSAPCPRNPSPCPTRSTPTT